MSKFWGVAGVVATAFALQSPVSEAQATHVPSASETVFSVKVREGRDEGIIMTPLPKPVIPTLISSCETRGSWTSLPEQDNSSMSELGRHICVNGDFTEFMPEKGATRAKTFNQLGLAYDYLRQKAQLGSAVQSGELDKANLPNMYVMQKPYANDSGNIVYMFELTVRRPTGEAGLPLKEETVQGTTRLGKITGLFEIAPTATTKAASLN